VTVWAKFSSPAKMKRPDVIEANTSSFHHVNKTTWSGDEQVAAAGDIADLITNVGSTIHDARPHV